MEVLDEYGSALDALRAEWPALFNGFHGSPNTVAEIRYVSGRLGLSNLLPEPTELLTAATKYLIKEKEPESVVPAVKSATQVTQTDQPASAAAAAGSW